jgi:hypothetical protein
MKGFLTKCLAAMCATGGLAFAGGCDAYRNLVDPCYPERYNFAARQAVNAAMAPQVQNGHILDQTVWNYHFEPGTDKLTPGGMDFLASLARRRPAPDPTVFIQTAQDITYDPANPDKFIEQRANLDNKRIQAVQNYLTAQTAGRHLSFEVGIHDPSEVGMSGTQAGLAAAKMYTISGAVPVPPPGAAGVGLGGGPAGPGR